MRVLIVEDDFKMASLIRRGLREKGLAADVAGKGEDAAQVDPDPSVRTAAAAAVKHMQRWRSFYSSIETLMFGLSLGSVLVLAGIGLAVTFGVMGVINMAHGELMMIGAYTVYVVQQLMPNHIGVSIIVAIPAAFLVAGLFGVDAGSAAAPNLALVPSAGSRGQAKPRSHGRGQ